MPPRGKLTQAEKRAARQRERDLAEAGGQRDRDRDRDRDRGRDRAEAGGQTAEHVPQGPPRCPRSAVRQSKLNAKLHAAASKGNTRRVEDLISRGASVDSGDESNHGLTALMLAAQGGHIDVVNALAGRYNANVEAVCRHGYTALMCAAHLGHTEIVNVLAGTYNANVDAANEDGKTALMHATDRGHTGVVNALRRHGASMPDDGITALSAGLRRMMSPRSTTRRQ